MENFTEFALRMVDDVVKAIMRPEAEPTPATVSGLPLAEQFRLSVLLADLEEYEAKLETLRVQEVEVRAILARALGNLAYYAEEASHRTGTRQWDDLRDNCDNLNNAGEMAQNARFSHFSILTLIAGVEDEIREARKEIDAACAPYLASEAELKQMARMSDECGGAR